MPYKDPEKQKAAQRRSYLQRREAILERARANTDERRLYAQERRQDLQRWIRSLKEGKSCTDCGRDDFPHFCYDFHHTRGMKVGGINELAMGLYSRVIIKAEIEKCDLVCAVCHRIRHYS